MKIILPLIPVPVPPFAMPHISLATLQLHTSKCNMKVYRRSISIMFVFAKYTVSVKKIDGVIWCFMLWFAAVG